MFCIHICRPASRKTAGSSHNAKYSIVKPTKPGSTTKQALIREEGKLSMKYLNKYLLNKEAAGHFKL